MGMTPSYMRTQYNVAIRAKLQRDSNVHLIVVGAAVVIILAAIAVMASAVL